MHVARVARELTPILSFNSVDSTITIENSVKTVYLIPPPPTPSPHLPTISTRIRFMNKMNICIIATEYF